MALTRQDLQRLADLSRLGFTEEEFVRMEQTIDPILDYVGRLSAIDTDGIPEFETMDEHHALRVDEAKPANMTTHDQIIANFPAQSEGLLKAPAVFEKPKG